MKYILIAATGRSASTTLQRIINTIPNSNISGENWGAINLLLLCYENLKKTYNFTPKNKNNIFYTSKECEKYKIKQAWYNNFDINEVKNNIKNTINSILSVNSNKYKILGFKEIRYQNNIFLLNTFLELFPNTKIICHIDDDLDRQSKSDWFKNNPEKSYQFLKEYNNELINYSKDNNKCYLSYKKNLFKINEIKKLFSFLDEPLNIEEYNFIINDNCG